MKQRVLLVGSDGHDLLNRISTLDLGRLPIGVKTFGLMLNAQGKIRASFWVTRRATAESELEFEPPFLEVLDQFTFAERYELRALPPADEPPLPERDRIAALAPSIRHEFQHDEATNPLEINLRSSIHDNKGCYPGQEVIEKIISLGSPARRLALLEASAATLPHALPLPLLDPGTQQEAGSLTSFDSGLGLAILRRTHLKPGLKLKVPDGTEFTVKRISE